MGREAVRVRNLIKKKMIDAGRDDFVNYLAEILNISRQTASNKLSARSPITLDELIIISKELHLNSEDLKEILGVGSIDG